MKIFNADMDEQLWRRVEVRAAVQGKSLQEFVNSALEAAVGNPNFNAWPKLPETNIIRKNVRISDDLWRRARIASARLDTSRRTYLTSALLNYLDGDEIYEIGDDLIMISARGLGLENTDFSLKAGGAKLDPINIITLFILGLRERDPRLLGWLQDIQNS